MGTPALPTYDDLAPEQQAVVREIVQMYQDVYLDAPNRKTTLVVSGAGGTGKTTAISVALTMIQRWLQLREQALRAAKAATTQLDDILASQKVMETYLAAAPKAHQQTLAMAVNDGIRSQRQKAVELKEAKKEAELDQMASVLAAKFLPIDQKGAVDYDF